MCQSNLFYFVLFFFCFVSLISRILVIVISIVFGMAVIVVVVGPVVVVRQTIFSLLKQNKIKC